MLTKTQQKVLNRLTTNQLKEMCLNLSNKLEDLKQALIVTLAENKALKTQKESEKTNEQ